MELMLQARTVRVLEQLAVTGSLLPSLGFYKEERQPEGATLMGTTYYGTFYLCVPIIQKPYNIGSSVSILVYYNNTAPAARLRALQRETR